MPFYTLPTTAPNLRRSHISCIENYDFAYTRINFAIAFQEYGTFESGSNSMAALQEIINAVSYCAVEFICAVMNYVSLCLV